MITLNDCTLPRNLGLQACNFIKKRLAQMLSCEFCKVFRNTFFTEHLWTIASNHSSTSWIQHIYCIEWNKTLKDTLAVFWISYMRSICLLCSGSSIISISSIFFFFLFFWKLLIILNFKDTCKAYHKRLFATVMLL